MNLASGPLSSLPVVSPEDILVALKITGKEKEIGKINFMKI